MVKCQMMSESDPAWVWFWEIFPWRISKLDARKAAAQVGLNLALMERIAQALGWQRRLWAEQGFGTPYPATYLRNQRWTDEPPPLNLRNLVSDKTARTLTSAEQFVRGGQE